jgi:hypothetical protein
MKENAETHYGCHPLLIDNLVWRMPLYFVNAPLLKRG